ncbi:hypothetical protein [Puerhibacterium puerhi]|uniref:hypothetical protein n=1 Tax=Puerhibacterium puerhi TaxID=2692623 RepID=UPI0013595BC0|nr:hypothetical protein [Puerhibacterium puerhi]
MPEPEIAEDVSFRDLDRAARERLRGLSKENAERVGLHLVMAGRLIDVDPELAYEHAQAAVRRGGRVDIVREAAGIAAYRTERYAEALRELRTVRRLNGSSEHLPIMADAERGLGRPERAIALATSPEADTLTGVGRVELALVLSGARADLGELDAALAVLDKIPAQQGDLGLRVLAARAAVLEAAGRTAEAAELLADVDPEALERAAGNVLPEEDVVVYDTFDEEEGVEDEDAADDGTVVEDAVASEGPADDSADDATDVPADETAAEETAAEETAAEETAAEETAAEETAAEETAAEETAAEETEERE